MVQSLFFLIPIALWIRNFLHFYSNGELKLIIDARICYIYNNFFLNNIVRGVYPFWNPFCNWGRPDDFGARMNGEFNPFLYLIVLLKGLGCSFSFAYFIYILSYFLLGAIGFYLLAKEVFNDSRPAYLAFLLLLFSYISTDLVNNFLSILMFVPAVWFFYFLVSFTKNTSRSSFWGVTFSLMVIFTTYMPFHFMATLLIFLFVFCFVYWADLKGIISRYVCFVRRYPAFVLLCLMSIALSLLPGIFWYLGNIRGELVADWRMYGSLSGNSIAIQERFISTSVFGSVLESFFSNHDDMCVSSFFVPVFTYICLWAGTFLKYSKRMVMLLFVGVGVLLFSLGDVSFLQPWCYQHIFFFKYFRNLHFLISGFAAFLILCACEQFRIFLERTGSSIVGQHRTWLIKVFFIHVAFFIFLMFQWRPTTGDYITVILSLAFFIAYARGYLKKEVFFYGALLIVVLPQPMELFKFIHKNTAGFSFPYSRSPYSFSESKPVFAFLRPTPEQEKGFKDTAFFGEVKDRSGIDVYKYMGTKWSYELKQHMDIGFLREYVRHKFVWYPFSPGMKAVRLFEDYRGQFIDNNCKQLRVEGFDLNFIRLHSAFNQEGYLIYNDSYDRGWRAYLDGKPLAIERANVAFKGLRIPAGEHNIELRYQPRWKHFLYFFLIGYFFFVFIVLIGTTLAKGLRIRKTHG